MNYGITKTTKYALVGGSWQKVESWTDARAIIDYAHWESWRRFDSAGAPKRATLKGQCGYMLSYTAYSPTGSEKIQVKLLKFLSGGSYLSNFDNLEKISDKEFKKLKRRAEACALYHGYSLADSCFITSCGVGHGFYFPNSEKVRGIFFCRGEAVLVSNELAEE